MTLNSHWLQPSSAFTSSSWHVPDSPEKAAVGQLSHVRCRPSGKTPLARSLAPLGPLIQQPAGSHALSPRSDLALVYIIRAVSGVCAHKVSGQHVPWLPVMGVTSRPLCELMQCVCTPSWLRLCRWCMLPHAYVSGSACPCLHVRHISNCMATYVEQGGPFKEPSHEWLAMPSVCVCGVWICLRIMTLWGRFHVGSCGKHQYAPSTAWYSTEGGGGLGPAVACPVGCYPGRLTCCFMTC